MVSLLQHYRVAFWWVHATYQRVQTPPLPRSVDVFAMITYCILQVLGFSRTPANGISSQQAVSRKFFVLLVLAEAAVCPSPSMRTPR